MPEPHHNDPAEACIEPLRRCCVQVSGHSAGCAFPVAPGYLLTCAHVVGRDQSPGASVTLTPWQAEPHDAQLVAVDGVLDLALLRDPAPEPCDIPRFTATPAIGDTLIAVGFPYRDGACERDQITAEYEGPTQRNDQTLLKLKGGQLEPGFSGGPLLSLNHCAVIGVTRYTRDRSSDLGGWGIPISTVRQFLAAHQVTVTMDKAPTASTAESLHQLQQLLLGLPGWKNARTRNALLQPIFFGHDILAHIQLDGAPSAVATELAQYCLETAGTAPTPDSPLCLLLAGIEQQFGATRHGPTIAQVRTLLGCNP